MLKIVGNTIDEKNIMVFKIKERGKDCLNWKNWVVRSDTLHEEEIRSLRHRVCVCVYVDRISRMVTTPPSPIEPISLERPAIIQQGLAKSKYLSLGSGRRIYN